jgi:hypothetical protein
MSDPIRIANCSGFYGDRLSAAREMVEGGPIDVLTGDWLAELTMLILHKVRARQPGGGFAKTFVTQIEQVMGQCLDRGIKIVSNAGGLDPAGCAEAIATVAERLGLHPRIAFVSGDDLLPRLAGGEELGLVQMDGGAPFADLSRFVTANAYLGCWGIVEALEKGADIVVTGRVTDAAVVCGPAAWRHRWAVDDWDRLAGAVVAGHVIECGTQATGGNYSFFTEVPDLARPGFPGAEIAADGSALIGKHDGTGGEVSIGTVTSQLIYEIAQPAYLGPDVTARFDTVSLTQVAPDRVLISGTRGEPPPPTLKVAMNEIGGFRNDVAVALTGLDIEEKAQLLEAAFWRACPYTPADFASVETTVSRTDHVDPETNEQATAVWRLSVKDGDERKVGRAVSNAVVELGLASIPGFYLLSGGPSAGQSYGVFRAGLVPAAAVPQQVVVLGGRTTVVSSDRSSLGEFTIDAPQPDDANPADPLDSTDDTVLAPLGRVVGARSGDKGGNANLGVFARDDAAWAWLDRFLTVDELRRLLPEAAALPIERYRLPLIRSLNFVIRGLLQEGVAATTRSDAQAKSLAEWLRARVVAVPRRVLG